MELLLEVVAVAQGPGAIDGVDGEDVPRGAPAPEVAAPAAVAVPDVVVVGRVEGRGDGGAPAPEVAAEVGCTIVGVGGGIPAPTAVATVAEPGVVEGGSAEGCRGAPAPNPVREASELLLPEAGLREEEGKMRRRSREEEGKRTLCCVRCWRREVMGHGLFYCAQRKPTNASCVWVGSVGDCLNGEFFSFLLNY